jgi:hypothetical protein
MKKNNINIVDFYNRRKESEASFKLEYLLLKNKILALVPEGLKEFTERTFISNDGFLESLFSFGRGRSDLHLLPQCTVFHSDLPRFNFRSLSDAEKKINKLKKAWDGIINITILTDSKFKTMDKNDYHLEVRFNF